MDRLWVLWVGVDAIDSVGPSIVDQLANQPGLDILFFGIFWVESARGSLKGSLSLSLFCN